MTRANEQWRNSAARTLSIIRERKSPKYAMSGAHRVSLAGSGRVGLAGFFVPGSALDAFVFKRVSGRGGTCVALVVFARWRPGKALAGALLFAFFDAMQLRL